MSTQETRLQELRNELKKLEEAEPYIKIPPGTLELSHGKDVSGMWIMGGLAPAWMIVWNIKHRQELMNEIEQILKSS